MRGTPKNSTTLRLRNTDLRSKKTILIDKFNEDRKITLREKSIFSQMRFLLFFGEEIPIEIESNY